MCLRKPKSLGSQGVLPIRLLSLNDRSEFIQLESEVREISAPTSKVELVMQPGEFRVLVSGSASADTQDGGHRRAAAASLAAPLTLTDRDRLASSREPSPRWCRRVHYELKWTLSLR